jgi:YD repeat-containing protein
MLSIRPLALRLLAGFSLATALALSPQAFADPVTYTYDALGRLTAVHYPNGMITRYAYDANSNRVHVTTTNGSSSPASPSSSHIVGLLVPLVL